jgi:hypothetical protein
MKTPKSLYIVLKLLTEFETMDGVEVIITATGGIVGLIPCYTSKKQAEKEACNGKYQILEVERPDIKKTP